MQYRNLLIHRIPILFVHKHLSWEDWLNHDKPDYTVFLSHGLGSKKEDNIKELEMLAALGLTAIGMDNQSHGERHQELKTEQQIIFCIERSAHDLVRLMDTLQTIRNGELRFGVTGISLGGMITYMAASIDHRFEVAIPILGRPDWEGPGSPHKRPEDFKHCRILGITAGLDNNVPPETTRKFHNHLSQNLSQYHQQFNYLEYPDSSHFMREEDWYSAMDAMSEFLRTWST